MIENSGAYERSVADLTHPMWSDEQRAHGASCPLVHVGINRCKQLDVPKGRLDANVNDHLTPAPTTFEAAASYVADFPIEAADAKSRIRTFAKNAGIFLSAEQELRLIGLAIYENVAL